MAFLGSLIGGIAGAVSTVAPIVSAVQGVGSLFRGSPTQKFQANLPSSPTWSPWRLRRHWQIPSRMDYVTAPMYDQSSMLPRISRVYQLFER